MVGQNCCPMLEVDGSQYTFKQEVDEAMTKYNCKDKCAYTKAGVPNLFCFGTGNTPSICKQGVTTAAPSGSGR